MGFYERLRIDESEVGVKRGRRSQVGPSFSIPIDGERVRLVVVACDCGRVEVANAYDVRRRQHQSCFSCRTVTHGKSKLPEYRVWIAMKVRCSDPKHSHYHNYGGRGIRVCDKWLESFEAFFSDVGPRPSPKHQIDRIDNNGDYEPGNVRWVTLSKNLRNTRQSRLVEYKGKTMTVADLCDLLPHLDKETIRGRVRNGWSGDRIASVPLQTKHRRRKVSL